MTMTSAQARLLESSREPVRAVRCGTVTVRPTSRPAPVDGADKGQLYRQWLRGVPLEVLAHQSGRSRSVVERAINEMRAHRILETKLRYVYDPCFDAPDAERMILASQALILKPSHPKTDGPVGLPPYLASLYRDAALLSREEEVDLFRKMNYLKHRASKLREALDPARAKSSDLDEIERLQEEALAVKNRIIRANLRLVVSIAKKRVAPARDLFELISDGNMSLIHAVEVFDFSRGFKFSTYASWAIIKNYARTIPAEKDRRVRFVTGLGEMFEDTADPRCDEQEYESDRRCTQEAVQGLLGRLDDRERRILVNRYGLGGAGELTLEQLGRELGITKERVRQIESRAQDKLRKFARARRPISPALSGARVSEESQK